MQLIRKKKKSVLIYYLVPGINTRYRTGKNNNTWYNYKLQALWHPGHYMVTLYYGIIIFIMARGWFVVVVNIVIMAFALLPALLVSD